MKFRWKLMCSYLVLILLLSSFFYFSFDRGARTFFMTEIQENLASQTRLSKLMVEREADNVTAQQLAEMIGATIKARVTLIDRNGTVTGDSDLNQARLHQLENHLMRPEIQQALQGGAGSVVRYSDTLKTSMLYTAYRYQSKAHNGFVRLALPLENLAGATEALHRMTISSIGLAILVALVLSMILSRITSRPLLEMAAVAGRIGKQEANARIPVTSNDEIGKLATVLNDMAERIDSQMKNLASEKARLDTILRGMGEGVMLASRNGVITLVNPAFRKLFGITDQIEGKNLIEISRNPDLQTAFHDHTVSGSEQSREIRIQRSNTTLLTHWVPLTLNGNEDGVVAVFHDISDLKYAEEMRRDFVANVSHELRTPVSVIKGYAETIMDGGMIAAEPDRASRFVEIIHRHSERLTTLINDILTLSSLEAREAALELNAMDISGTIAKSCALLAAPAAEKEIRIHNETHSGLPKVLIDQGRLEQVLVNLIDNAIKYTPSGGAINITTETLSDFVRVSVKDTGMGIPLKDQPRIFERFYRVDGGRSRDQGGTGLGLAIAKHIIQLHGGELTVASAPGSGSIFAFTVKLAPLATDTHG